MLLNFNHEPITSKHVYRLTFSTTITNLIIFWQHLVRFKWLNYIHCNTLALFRHEFPWVKFGRDSKTFLWIKKTISINYFSA